MTSVCDRALQYTQSRRDSFLSTLNGLLSIPTISALSEHADDLRRAAQWLRQRLDEAGMQRAQVFETPWLPIVYAEWLGAPGAPTVLIYGHYDVQPVDPLQLWHSPPFTPTVAGDDLCCRGASDMKGAICAALAAVEALRHSGGLPVNIKWLLEGEEESGSPSLPGFIDSHRELLAADGCVNMDGAMLGADMPTIVYGLRGLSCFELRLQGPSCDLHSGRFGGVVHNPAQVLADLLAGMHDAGGRVSIPAFYDRVQELCAEERAELGRHCGADAHFLEASGAPALWGEEGYTAGERAGVRPTLEINGVLSGFTGEGYKTVLPATAMAKLSMRLVPEQDPHELEQGLKQYLTRHVPPTVRWELHCMPGSPGVQMDRDTPVSRALAAALEQTWGKRVCYVREGGSVPVVGMLQRQLGIPTAMSGLTLPDDRIHGPNEKLHIPTWHKGIDALVRFFCAGGLLRG